MLIPVNKIDDEIEKLIKDKCGDRYTIMQRIRKRNYGSHRYKLIKISPKYPNLNLENHNNNIFLNFDLRDKGIVFYFRYKNKEYVEFCSYTQISFQSNDCLFVLQTDKYLYNFNIINKKNHLKFISKIYQFIEKQN